MKLTPAQRKAFRLAMTNHRTLLYGGWGSGKSVAAATALIVMMLDNPGNYILAGTSYGAIRRNVKPILEQLLDFELPILGGAQEPHIRLGGSKAYLFGGSDAGRESSLRGFNAAGALVDEVTLCNESFLTEVIGRVRYGVRRIVCTTNPAPPNHWVKRNWLDGGQWASMMLNPDDNPHLDPQVIADWKAQLTGAAYSRFILGQWALSEGLIYPNWQESNPPPGLEPDAIFCGIDYAASSQTAAVWVARYGDTWYIVSEWVHNGSNGVMQPLEQFQAIRNHYPALEYIIDPSATALIDAGRRLGLDVRKADNSVLPGLHLVASLFTSRNLLLSANTPLLQDCLSSYSWDSKAALRGEDKPLKAADVDHLPDALRYVAMRHLTSRHRNILALMREQV